VAFLLLYLVMFLGLSIKTPLLNKLIKPINSLNVHTWLSVQALFFVFVHMGALLFDKYLNFGIYDITVPFISKLYTNEVALGILGMYLMVLLIVNSYFRKFISYKLWRFSHYLNIVLYIIVVAHGFFLGTDLKNEIVRNIFIGMNLFLMMIIVVNIITKIINYFKLRNNSHL
jgi:predicted ferric reductase